MEISKKRETFHQKLRKGMLRMLLLTLPLQGSVQALAAGWTFDRDTEIWTYHESETLTNQLQDLKKGWHQDQYDGYRYYFDPDSGHMLHGWHTIDGYSYYFTDIRNRDNYFQQEDGFWYYRANGLVPFGALVEQETDSNSSDSVGKTSQPEAEEDVEVPKPETPKEEVSEPENEESQETQEPQKPDPPEAEEPDQEPCIETDSWEEILAQPTVYHNCIEEHCEKELLVRGYRVTEEENQLVATDSCTEPVMVSVAGIETDGAGTATFVMTEACSAFTMPMSESLYYCNFREETFESRSTGGWQVSVVYTALNGGILSYKTGPYTLYQSHFKGFELLYETEDGRQKKMTPVAVDKPSGSGYYFEWLANSEEEALERVRSRLWLLSEMELFGENWNSISGEGVPYEGLAQPAETYWLRSSASNGMEGYFVTSDGNAELASCELPLRFGFVIR